jgi:hypothetical protein
MRPAYGAPFAGGIPHESLKGVIPIGRLIRVIHFFGNSTQYLRLLPPPHV